MILFEDGKVIIGRPDYDVCPKYFYSLSIAHRLELVPRNLSLSTVSNSVMITTFTFLKLNVGVLEDTLIIVPMIKSGKLRRN